MDNERDEHERRAEQATEPAGAATAECESDQRADTVWSLFGRSTEQTALSHSRGDFCWSETIDSPNGNVTLCGHDLSKALLGGQDDDAATEERLRWSHARLSLRGRRTCASHRRKRSSATLQRRTKQRRYLAARGPSRTKPPHA